MFVNLVLLFGSPRLVLWFNEAPLLANRSHVTDRSDVTDRSHSTSANFGKHCAAELSLNALAPTLM